LGSIRNVANLIEQAVEYASWDIDILGTLNPNISVFILNLFKLGFTTLDVIPESIDELLPKMVQINQHPQPEHVHFFILVCHETWFRGDPLKLIDDFYHFYTEATGWHLAIDSTREILPIVFNQDILMMVSEGIKGGGFSSWKGRHDSLIEPLVTSPLRGYEDIFAAHRLFEMRWLLLGLKFASDFHLSPDWRIVLPRIEVIISGWTELIKLMVARPTNAHFEEYRGLRAALKTLTTLLLSPEHRDYESVLPDIELRLSKLSRSFRM
jgi:hypothetical protein